MPFTTLSLGLTIDVPTVGTRNYGARIMQKTWIPISQHDHTGSGRGTPLPSAAFADRVVTSVKLALNWGEVKATTLTPAGTTQTIDFANGKIQKIDLGSASGDVTATLSTPAEGAEYKILIVQGAVARDIVWPAAVLWANAQKPILSELANDGIAKVRLLWDGTNYFGEWELSYA